jgi:Na+-transporting NADH:ubiquinone oxidoreductase subunit E
VKFLELFVQAAFVQNLALSFFLGMCMFLAVSRRMGTAVGFGLAVLVVQTITLPVNHLIHRHLLRQGALAWAGLPEVDLSFLGLITYIGVIAAMVQVLEMVLDRFFPALFTALGIYLPLLTVNCAVLGGSLFMVQRDYDLPESVVFGFSSGFGWLLAIVLFAGICERLRFADPPAGLRGLGLTFLVVGLVSMGFMAFAGLEIG